MKKTLLPNPRSRLAGRQTRHGFSLLEMMIVLVVMAGLLAIVWPNLQRPLRRTQLGQAAEQIREMLDQSRYQSMMDGHPYFVHLLQGEGDVQAGPMSSFLNGELNQPPLASSQSPDPSVKVLRTTHLPKGIVVFEVRWTIETASVDESEGAELVESAETPSRQEDRGLPQDSGATELFKNRDAGSIPNAGQDWWIPMSASGYGRDAAIVLLDRSNQETLTITYRSATGAMEIVR